MSKEEDIRQISYVRYIWSIVIAGLLSIIDIVIYFISKELLLKWGLVVSLLIIVPCITATIVFGNKLIVVKRINRELRILPFKFDYEKEYSTYCIIGRKKPRIKNGAILYQKYSQWKEHVKENCCSFKNKQDYYRFLNRLYRSKVEYREVLNIVFIPAVVAVTPTMLGIGENASAEEKLFMATIWVVMIILHFSAEKVKATREVDFLRDYMEIVKEQIDIEK